MNANDTPLQGRPPHTCVRLTDFHLSYGSPFQVRDSLLFSPSSPHPSFQTVFEIKGKGDVDGFSLTHISRAKSFIKIKGLHNWMHSTISYYKACFLHFKGDYKRSRTIRPCRNDTSRTCCSKCDLVTFRCVARGGSLRD